MRSDNVREIPLRGIFFTNKQVDIDKAVRCDQETGTKCISSTDLF